MACGLRLGFRLGLGLGIRLGLGVGIGDLGALGLGLRIGLGLGVGNGDLGALHPEGEDSDLRAREAPAAAEHQAGAEQRERPRGRLLAGRGTS